MKYIKDKNKTGFIALAAILLLLLFSFSIPKVFDLIRDIIMMVALTGVMILLWRLLSQVENLSQELSSINKTLINKSEAKLPTCKSCGKKLITDVNFCPDCGSDQR